MNAERIELNLLPYGADPLAALADRLLADFADDLPHLDRALVLLPEADAAPRLRRLLLERAAALGIEALLGPGIHPLTDWVNRRPLARRVLDERACELILVEALRRHRSLFGQANLWALAESLLQLFGELTRHRVGLPANAEDFKRLLAQAYGDAERSLGALGMEARLVHALWQAWHQELETRQCIDSTGAYLLRLVDADAPPGVEHCYVAGFPRIHEAEHEWLEGLAAGGCAVTLLAQSGPQATTGAHPDAPPTRLAAHFSLPLPAIPDDPYSRFLDAVFAGYQPDAPTLAERAPALARSTPDPASARLFLFAADGAEQEARAVDLQVRRWLLEGRRTVAVVTENRRLARRIRALLERAGVEVRDRAGWALSTTSAAAALERWLECIEEDFPHSALLDLLKSPFFGSGRRERHLATVYRFEQDIVFHENVGRGLEAYGQHLASRRRRLRENMGQALNGVERLLERLGRAARPLRPLLEGRHPPAEFMTRLLKSLEQLGLTQALERDAAGAAVMAELTRVHRAAEEEAAPLHWSEWRGWLGQALERSHFRPPVSGGPVTLLGLGQSTLGRFDALVIAGAERDHLPGGGAESPFFNEQVRRELGLVTAEEQLAERFHQFRRLLQAAPRVLVTYRREQDGEPVIPSPWVEGLAAFHHLAYGTSLTDPELATLAGAPQAEVTDRRAPLPPRETRPNPAAAAALLPPRISASAYQQLMDCPYQFHAARMLRLAPPDVVREALEKSDYGQRVHRCLEAFHAGVETLPGPFGRPVTLSNRAEATALLEAISRQVFAEDLADNFLHRGWLERWLAVIPAYVEWEVARSEHWRFEAAEVTAGHDDRIEGVKLEGRLDRIDRGADGLAVIDYKTGYVPHIDQVLAGESIQLPFYAALAEASTGQPVARCEYLALDKTKADAKAVLEGEELSELKEQVTARLEAVYAALRQGHPLPAWGDAGSCERCAMDGLCRRQAW